LLEEEAEFLEKPAQTGTAAAAWRGDAVSNRD
jgi:hypothetical protein